MRKRKIIYTEEDLTREDRKNFPKTHPGERLCFRLRFPYFPFWLSVFVLTFQIIALIRIVL